jgi:nitrogen fixation protein NifB
MTTLEPPNKDCIKLHPCFSEDAHRRFGKVHLPIAPACNIQCNYCRRVYDCVNESRPGITSRVLTPEEAVERTRLLIDRSSLLSVVGIAGPGDPLLNAATFVVLRHLHWEYPDLTLCVSTNGLLLPDRLEQLIASGVRSLSVTINAVTPETAEKIYRWINYHGRRYQGRAAAELMLSAQWQGLENAVDAGMIIKVNTVFIPGVNEQEIPLIAKHAGLLGADVMKILPLTPRGEFEHLASPIAADIDSMREKCATFIPQMTDRSLCGADSCDMPGGDADSELEVLMKRINDECDGQLT